MQRYFVDKSNDGSFIFTEQDFFHITKVMRFKQNDNIEVVYNGSVSVVNIDSTNPLRIHTISTYQESSELNKKLVLFLPLLKSDKSELIIQKATEIGVSDIIFYFSKRSIIKLSQEDFNKKLTRYNMIAKEASEQCHRNIIPNICGVISLNQIDQYLCENNLLAYELESGSTKSFLDKLDSAKSTSIIVGPEGGFETSEVELLKTKGFSLISLGKRILRVETAAIYALSVISFWMEK